MKDVELMLAQSSYYLGWFFDWLSKYQIEVFLSLWLLAILVFIMGSVVAISKFVQRRKVKKPERFAEGICELDRIIQEGCRGMQMALEDPNVRVLPVPMVKKMMGNCIHELLVEATNKKVITEREANSLRTYLAFRLGDLELLPPKEDTPPPSAKDLKAAIRARTNKGEKPAPLPTPEQIKTVEVTKGDSLAALLRGK